MERNVKWSVPRLNCPGAARVAVLFTRLPRWCKADVLGVGKTRSVRARSALDDRRTVNP